MLLQENVALGIIPEYFEKYYILALNLALFGSGLGIIVTPLITQLLRDIYGWRGALLLLAGINMHSLIFGALLKPRPKQCENYKIPPHKRRRNSNAECGDMTMRTKTNFRQVLTSGFDDIGGALLCNLSFIVQVLIVGFFNGYLVTGWMIYMVSLATSKGASLKEASVIATCGGVGMLLGKLALPLFVHRFLTYKQALYIGSIITAVSACLLGLAPTVLGLSLASVLYGIGFAFVGSEIYAAIKVITEDLGCPEKYTIGVSWFHLFHGVSSIIAGVITGKQRVTDKVHG